jgi:hypothetical protein
MLSLSLAWHIVWWTRVTLSLVLFAFILRRQLYKEFPLFTVFAGWISLAGSAVLAVNYAPFTNGKDYFVAVAISNGVEAVLSFAIVYQMFTQSVQHYPAVRGLGKSAFRAATLILVAIAIAFAWLSPGPEPRYLTSLSTAVQTALRILLCGQLVFLFLFSNYFRLSWRNRTFGIALGLGILSSTSLAINAVHSQIASTITLRTWYMLGVANESTYMVAVLMWLAYLRASESVLPPPVDAPPQHELETWNHELERLWEP